MSFAPPARLAAGLAVAATLLGTALAAPLAAPAAAATSTGTASPGTALPQITSLSAHRGDTGCGSDVTITGQNFVGVTGVRFGSVGVGFQVTSPSQILAYVPAHGRAQVTVRVLTTAGTSPRSSQAGYAWVNQPLSVHRTKLNCGMTAAQLMANSATFRRTASQHVVAPVRRAGHWTAAIGQNAVRRAQAWTGLSYSWAGGNASGPTYGINTSGGGWFDGRIWGFDCSGLTLYAWAPYKSMAHFAASQYRQAGRFHPTPNELMPGDLIFYSGNGHADGIEHVQLYVGRGQVVQAPQSGYTIGTATLSAGPGRPFFAATRPLTGRHRGSAPRVTRLSRTAGPATGTTTVIAYGTGLNRVSTVLVSGVRTYAFTPLSSHRLKITLPAHAAGDVAVRIGGAWGLSGALPFSYLGAPTVTGLTPNQGSAGVAQDVTISGTGFVDVTGVSVGGAAATFTVASALSIAATMPALPAGTYPVVVTTKYGTSTGWASFTAEPPPPTP